MARREPNPWFASSEWIHVTCDGRPHRVMVTPAGAYHLADHSRDEVRNWLAMADLGGKVPDCVGRLLAWRRSLVRHGRSEPGETSPGETTRKWARRLARRLACKRMVALGFDRHWQPRDARDGDVVGVSPEAEPVPPDTLTRLVTAALADQLLRRGYDVSQTQSTVTVDHHHAEGSVKIAVIDRHIRHVGDFTGGGAGRPSRLQLRIDPAHGTLAEDVMPIVIECKMHQDGPLYSARWLADRVEGIFVHTARAHAVERSKRAQEALRRSSWVATRLELSERVRKHAKSSVGAERLATRYMVKANRILDLGLGDRRCDGQPDPDGG